METIQSLSGTNPDISQNILVKATHQIVGKRVRIVCRLLKVYKFIAVKSIKAIPGSDPYETEMILQNGMDNAIGRAVLPAEITPVKMLLGKQTCQRQSQRKKQQKSGHRNTAIDRYNLHF